jgi:hypothetical protein
MNFVNGKLFGREPVVILGLIEAGIALALSFGLELSGEQIGSIMAFLTVLVAVLVRSAVVPANKYKELENSAPEVLILSQEDAEAQEDFWTQGK